MIGALHLGNLVQINWSPNWQTTPHSVLYWSLDTQTMCNHTREYNSIEHELPYSGNDSVLFRNLVFVPVGGV